MNITDGAGVNDNLVLNSASFTNNKILENLHIDNVTWVPGNEAGSTAIGADPAHGKFSDYATALLALEDKL
ncbi:MAG TPA: hypothetical protein VN698_09985 [Bacteroidia bacterium]|nr:hypothetical protein [Bacteroidia bacterium]